MLTALILVSLFAIGSDPPKPDRIEDEDDRATLAKRVELLECQHLLDRIDIDELESEVLALRLNGPMISEKDRAALQKRRNEILQRTLAATEKDAGVRYRHCHELIDAAR